MGDASGQQLREASEKAQEPSRGGCSDCKGPSMGSGVCSKGGWREMRGESQLTPTGTVVEFVAEIDQD